MFNATRDEQAMWQMVHAHHTEALEAEQNSRLLAQAQRPEPQGSGIHHPWAERVGMAWEIIKAKLDRGVPTLQYGCLWRPAACGAG